MTGKPKRKRKKKEKRLKRFHFSCGNSSDGPVGFCASVYAYTDTEAVKILRDSLPEETGELEPFDGSDRVDYIQAYFNASAISKKDIDFVEDLTAEQIREIMPTTEPKDDGPVDPRTQALRDEYGSEHNPKIHGE